MRELMKVTEKINCLFLVFSPPNATMWENNISKKQQGKYSFTRFIINLWN